MATYTNAELVAQIYIGFYDRAPDPVGLQYWIGRLEAGVSVQDIGDSFAASPEASDTYPYFKFPGLLSPDDFLAQVYQNVFGRDIDDDGLDYYKARLESGESVGSVMASILGNAATNDDGEFPDQGVLANKVAVGLYWANEAVETNADIYEADGATLNAAAKAAVAAVIAGVTDDPATVTAAEATADAFFGGGTVPGATINLDGSIGTAYVGTAGPDVFNGVLDAAAADSTLRVGNTLDGLGGNDVFNLLVTGGTALPAGVSTKNIETINITYDGGNIGDIDSATFAGAKEIWQISSGDNFHNITVGAGVTAGFSGEVVIGETVTAAAGVSSVSVALKGVDDLSVVTIDETTAKSVGSVDVSGSTVKDGALDIDLAAASVKVVTLELTSATDVDITGNLAKLATVDASGSTGNLTIDLTNLTGLEHFSSGSGSDDVTAVFANFKAEAVSIDLGAGNDAIDLDISAPATAVALTLAGGAGGDTFAFTTLGNIDADDFNDEDFSHTVSITDFGNGKDVLALDGFTVFITSFAAQNVVDTAISGLADGASLFDAVTAVADAISALPTPADFAQFVFDGNTYVYNDAGNNGLNAGDSLIELVGVHVLDANNVIAA